MTSERPWRSPMSDEEAMARLRREAGTRFDPAVVDAFDECLNTALARSTAPAEAP